MKNIQMVDLLSQYKKIKPQVDEAIEKVIENSAFIKGPAVREFAENLEKYLDVGHVIPCGNGTDALQVALMSLDLKPGDEIITSPFTFIATIEVIRLLGLKPVLADIDETSFNIDPEEIRKKISASTKCIIPVHLFGQCCDMESIMMMAKEYKLAVIEDTAQALGADYHHSSGKTQKAGTIGQLGCTSFFPSKNLGAFGDGGAIFTADSDRAQKLQALVNHGMKKRYYYDYVGVNSRLDSIQAAILNEKLTQLDSYHQARQEAASYYITKLGFIQEIELPVTSKFTNHIYHQFTLKVNDEVRDDLKNYLSDKGIPSMIYYPVGLHVQEAYQDLGYKEGDFPVTEKLCKKVLSLPMHTELDEEQLDYICTQIINYFN